MERIPVASVEHRDPREGGEGSFHGVGERAITGSFPPTLIVWPWSLPASLGLAYPAK